MFLSDGVVMVDPPNSIPIMWTIVLGRADWCCGICHTPRLNRKKPPQQGCPEASPSSVTPTVGCPALFKRHAPAPQGFETARTLRAKA